MAKRIVTRIGNVFCAEVEGGRKRYFQYICNDMCQLNSSVIRVFKTRYRMEDNPTIEEIVNDGVDFYAHTVLRPGIANGAWYKVGTSKNIGNGEHLDVLFATTSRDGYDVEEHRAFDVDPMKNWIIIRINCFSKHIGELPGNINGVESGCVFPFVEIISRCTCGYYKYSGYEYDRIRRIPYADVNSYLRRNIDGKDVYFHFLGDKVLRAIIDGVNYSLEQDEVMDVDAHLLYLKKLRFGDINWKNKEFIFQEDFENAWNRDYGVIR